MDLGKVIVGLLEKDNISGDDRDEAPRSGLDAHEAHLSKCQKLVDNRQIVLLWKMGSAFLAKLRNSGNQNKRVRIADDLYVTGNSVSDDFGSSSDHAVASASAVREGLDVYIRMHRESKNPAIRALAKDRALFNEMLWQLEIGSFMQKAAFAQDFVAKHVKDDNWVKLLMTDVILITRHLTTGAGGSKQDRGSRGDDCRSNKNGSDGGNYNSGNGSRSGYRGGGFNVSRLGNGSGGGDSGNEGEPCPALFCRTRIDPAAGRCMEGPRCQDDHHCLGPQ